MPFQRNKGEELVILSSSRGDNYEPFHNFFNFMSIDIPALRDIPATADCGKCPRIYYPICADDNITYINECRLNCYNANRKGENKAHFVRTGPCVVFPEFN
ncbi:hypothetical protein KGM_208165 [Danaus plexippus plexippus]|uniref:Kazal-like domain-containing protein n=1 Tax=Danaus plexippus plexippus TaxID=278856 RepID=A0A212FH28_DANPL|nr:hypothetical protein KGM_208165 [Danaus plexippus plexippus]